MRVPQVLAGALAVILSTQALASYDPNTALQFVYLSAAAYCDNSTLLNWTCEACQHVPVDVSTLRVHYHAGEDVRGFTAKLSNENAAIVSFRGTSNIENWIQDIKAIKHVPYPRQGCSGCEVADGFVQSYDLLRGGVLASLQSMGFGPGSTVYITGHSLGAAMAGLCAFDLQALGYSVSGYSFGQPRDGDSTYASTFQERVPLGTWYRVVHYADIVPHLPPELVGFHHTSQEVWYTEDSSSYKVCDGSGEDSSCSDSLDFPTSVSDHLHYLNVPISRSC